MVHTVLVAPSFGGSMLHCMKCFADIEDCRLGILTAEPEDRIPAELRPRLAGHYRIDNPLDPAQLVRGVRAFQAEWGRVDRLEGYLEQLQVALADARDATGIDGMGGQAARNFRDKHRMKEVLRQAGVPVARQALVTGPEDARRFVAEVGFPIVLKPVDGVGGRATVRVVDESSLGAALNQLLPSPRRPAQAEEFVVGDEHSFEAVVVGGEVVWCSATHYSAGPLRVLETPWEQYCLVLPRDRAPHVEAFRPINAQALAALGLQNGISHMEWFQTARGPVVSEVGARPPGSNIMPINGAAFGVDMWQAWARLQVHRTWELPPQSFAAGCAFLKAHGAGRIVGPIEGLDAVAPRLRATVVASRLPSPGQPRSTHYEGDGYVIVKHEQTEEVIAALRELVTQVRITAR